MWISLYLMCFFTVFLAIKASEFKRECLLTLTVHCLGGTVVQWLSLSLHNKKVPNSTWDRLRYQSPQLDVLRASATLYYSNTCDFYV